MICNKWRDELEDILLCPYCMNVPQSDIRQCTSGHHICKDCCTQYTVCPACTSRWSTARNRLAEDLCSKFGDMKLSLIDPELEIKKLLIPDTNSTSCQTDDNTIWKSAKTINKVPRGSYPCCIGTCRKLRFFKPLMNHLRNDHPDHFLQLSQEGNVFKHTWTFEVIDNMTFDWAIEIIDMGTFFLKLSTDFFGNLKGSILMVQSTAISRTYTYQLQVCCCLQHNSPTYYSTVRSCRLRGDALPEECLEIKRFDLQHLKDHKKQLECHLTLSKKSQTTRPQKKKKNTTTLPTASGQN